jgi:hypothetical protein
MAGKEPKQNNTNDASYVVGFILLFAAAWLLWSQARPLLVVPLFAMDWLQYQLLAHLPLHAMHDERGLKSLNYVHYYVLNPRKTFSLDWQDVADIQADIGARMRYPLVFIICGLAVWVIFKMKGDGFRTRYTLTGSAYEEVVRLAGIQIRKGMLRRIITGGFRFRPLNWLTSPIWFLLNVTKLVRKRKEWVRNGGSFIHYQASYWKVVQPGAHFDPDKTSENENQGRTPPEWIRDQKIAFTKGVMDEDAAEEAFKRQLGPVWQGVENAPYYVQAVCVLAVLNAKHDKRGERLREELAMVHTTQPARAEQASRLLLQPYMSKKEMVDAINRKGAENAYLNTAVIGIYAAGGPMGEWGGGEAGVFATSMIRWLKPLDRTLWYCLNNVGRRSFFVEAAGAISHFQAERVLRQPLIDPYLESALDGLIGYMEEKSLEDVESVFRKKAKFA